MAAGRAVVPEERAPCAPREARAKAPHYAAVDGLRALAVIAVLAFHLRETMLPGGLMGVDIFFVISGFVVTASVSEMRHGSFRAFVLHFYARRIVRILPALAVTIAVSSLAYALFIPSAWLADGIAKTGLAAIFGLSNLVLAAGDDYFSPKAAFNVFTHTWSLGVEEQFYLLFPVIMYFGPRLAGPAHGRTVIVLALLSASLVTGAVLSATQPLIAFYTLPARFWELGAGMLLCLTLDRWRPVLARARRLPAALALGSFALVAFALAQPARLGFPVPWGAIPVLGTLGLIALAVACPATLAVRALAARPWVGIGRMSYSLYLWHWPVYVLMRWTVGLETVADGLVALSVTVALAGLSYRYVEVPARAWQRDRRWAPARVVRTGLAAACVLAVATGGLLKFKSAFVLGQTHDLAAWYPEGRWTVPPKPGCTMDKQVTARSGGLLTVLHPEGCGSASGGRLIVAGDSHAGAYERMLWTYAYATGRAVNVYWLAGCPMIGLLEHAPTRACADFEAQLADELARVLTPADVVFLPSLRVPRFIDQWGASGQPAGTGADVAEAPGRTDAATARSLLARIGSSGARIVFEAPKPLFKAPPFRCADWFDADNPVCRPGFAMDREGLEQRRAPVLARMTALAQDQARLSIWDPFPSLCPDPTCHAFRDGHSLFFDADHLSGYGNDVLFPAFKDRLEREFRAAATASYSAVPGTP
ncbi:acyltransferase family protein [uncultured Methylobacterium sp.]|uniref:acyltransferase family protein n=1 Tax=uncultured Methylobacterium sp. TaxID=157278 RepID=UPI0035C970D9